MDVKEKIDKQHALGKLTAKERIDLLFDEGSFVEVSPETFDGVVTGYGRINGVKAAVSSQDFTYRGGTLGEVHARKICGIMDYALKNSCPFIAINDSGGARIDEGISALNGYANIFLRNTKASGRIPQIAAIMGPCAGGACYSPAICDFVFMVENHSQMFITGPAVVKEVTGEDTDVNSLGGAEIHGQVSGCAHFVYKTDEECIKGIRKLLSYLPGSCSESPRVDYKGYSYVGNPAEFVNANIRKAYDVHAYINAVVDDDSFFEIQSSFAQNVVIGLARFSGAVAGIVANNPAAMAGVLDIDASDKAARFVRFCDNFNIPIVTFVDTPGYMPGSRQEHGGIIRHGAKLLYAYSEAAVPKISVILRKAFGGAYIAMNSKGMGGDYACAWPDAQIAVMGAEGAVDIIRKKELAASPNKEELRNKFIEEYSQEFLNPKAALANGYIDEIIEPLKTREIILKKLELLSKRKRVSKSASHGNIPL